MDEIYFSIADQVSSLIKIEGSKFFADVFPIDSEEEAEKYLQGICKKYYAATHHCFAYALGAERATVRYSDDGEPSGTAGVKILSAIQSKNLSDLIVIVTRYFGGIKLGVGGLGRTYFDTACEGLLHAVIVKKVVMQSFEIHFPFTDTNPVMNLVTTQKLAIVNRAYTDIETMLTVLAKPSHIQTLIESLTNATRGKATCIAGIQKTITLKQ